MHHIIDGHCDVLWKLIENDELTFFDEKSLQVNMHHIKNYEFYLQNFAIFVEPPRFSSVLQSVKQFKKQIIIDAGLQQITDRRSLLRLKDSKGFGALLSLEGLDGLDTPIDQTKQLYLEGLRILSLTWNDSNWAADGTYGTEHNGLSDEGRTFLEFCKRIGMIIDVSHLSDSSFADVLAYGQLPVLATHSNARAICNHPRNLNNQQIRQLIDRNGIIGLNFVPFLVHDDESSASIEHLIRHIEHICNLGGAFHIALGSDFDGCDRMIRGLENPCKYVEFIELLRKYYPEEFIEQMMWKNFYRFLYKHLPNNQSNFDINSI